MIRPFNTGDLSITMEIWLDSSIKAHPFIDRNYFVMSYEKFMRDQLLANKSFVYEIEGKVVAFISIQENMTIAAINVAWDYRNKGIGEKLLDFAIEKYQQLNVELFRDNTDTIEFFTDNGFEVLGLSEHNETPYEMVIMAYQQDQTSRN